MTVMLGWDPGNGSKLFKTAVEGIYHLGFKFIHLQIRAKYIYARNFMCTSDTGITGTIGNQFVYVRYQLTRNVRIN